MDFKYIKLISAIVDCGSITKAAQVLNLTQSALSHQLKEAETLNGIKFFTRSNRKLNLTPAGKMVYDVSGKILPEISKLEVNLKNFNSLKHGTIRLSAACSTSYHWLPKLLQSFKSEYPNVDLEIILENSANPVNEIIKGKIDISIIISPIENENIDYKFLFKDELVVVFSEHHKFNKKQYLIAKDFIDEHLIIHSKPLDTVVFYEQVLKPKGIEPFKISELPLTEATIELIKVNYGVAVMSRKSIEPFIKNDSISIKKINPKGLYRNHYAAILKSSNHPEYLEKFISYLSRGL
ncbi:LysR family transcriptional regulator [Fluviicola sp.]|uniref:LysR family transcriptional regulator n=1 Tax=Fluviicola sp. TaxID=1917219 RepID=UPI003D298355